MKGLSALRRLLEFEAPDSLRKDWRRVLYWAAWVATAALGVALLLASLNAAAMWPHDGIGWGWMAVRGLGMLLLWALIIALLVALARETGERR